MADKMRVHTLAKDLNVSSKTIIDKCKAEGIDTVKNHMSTLSAGLHATILEWFSSGNHETALETAQPVDLVKVQIKSRKRKTAAQENAETFDESEGGEVATAVLPEPPLAEQVISSRGEATAEFESDHIVEIAAPSLPKKKEIPAPDSDITTPESYSAASRVQPITVEQESSGMTAAEDVATTASSPKSVQPAGPQNIPAAAKLQGPRVVRYEAPERHDLPPRPAVRRRTLTPEDIAAPPAVPPTDPASAADKAAIKRKGRINPRRTAGRLSEAGERLNEWRNQDLVERRERLAGVTGRKIHRRQTTLSGRGAVHTTGPKTTAIVHEPIRLKEFCAVTGFNFIQLFKVLREEHSILANINMILEVETAQLLALQGGIELTIVPAKTMLDDLQDEVEARKRTKLERRPPVVTMLGHVDHGKTSLLDAIRTTTVAAAEDGGITQHLGSYHIQTSHGPVTFLDTPGHEAFTAMRARGAQMTDVVVLVVAADDGVMPQTIEAIRHAQAAEVPIVVALNKIDLGDQNKLKTYGQLSEHGLAPSEWGGEVDVIGTSATKGTGVQELVEHLADLSSLLDLKADTQVPASGTVIEAETKLGVGSVVRVLVQEGVLSVGQIVVCGNAFGKVRALIDDRGERVTTAGPSIPVEIWGLDDVPAAGDKFYVVESTQRAKDIASEMKQRRVSEGRRQTRRLRTLEEMFSRRDSEDVPELNIVLKGDVEGSVAVLKQALSEIPSDEVNLMIRHAGVGPVNDSDVLLASTCDGIVVAFRVESSVGARRLADENGVEIRPYRVIYDVCDDIKKALEGLLSPEERIESRAVMEVRQIFQLSKVGVIAGSFVTQGTVDRSHLVKVIRDGVVVRENCRVASLRHFKDDVREVRSNLECGIRLEGFNDLHPGDRLETYEIIKIARTL